MAESAKYPKEKLSLAVSSSYSFAQVMRKLGMTWSGGQQQNLKRWISRYGLDTSHFTGQAHQRGRRSINRSRWEDVLKIQTTDWRIHTSKLRRALLDSGAIYKCFECGQGDSWRGKKLVLEINHKNGDWKDNRRDNLEFLCPNCHSTTDGFSRRD
jgi:predicted RNA-binding Zn-ribbon protein involved in translation (DUF1610 family)